MKKIVSAILTMSVLGFANVSMAKVSPPEQNCSKQSSAGMFSKTNPVRTVATKSSRVHVAPVSKTKAKR
ncbi:MAG: hypothetical protein HUU57_11810 [Bdellovibrio sp.]|nr:hypothetical protein [Bdellovibrio sp.]